MAAAPRKPPVPSPKKRKVRHDDAPPPGPPKKKSPLFDKPQNFYAPPAVASMSKDALMAWRKEQRRKRNRESAAASRNKQRSKIEELEGEVGRWKASCRDMEARMRCMERHVLFLTQWHGNGRRGAGETPPSLPPALVSHPASPSGSPPPTPSNGPRLISPPTVAVPNAVTSSAPPLPVSPPSATHLFPPLSSDPKDSTLAEEEAAAAVSDEEESRKHLTPISRHAVKITGAISDSSTDDTQQQQHSLLSVLNSFAKTEDVEEVGSIVSSDTIEETAIEVARSNEATDEEKSQDVLVSSPQGNTDSDLSDDDDDFLDLLVDTLDANFDPNLLL